MIILGSDTSTKSLSVAIKKGDRVLFDTTVKEGITHSVNHMPLIEKSLEKTGLTYNDIDLFACTTGPGSYTGIRINLSTLKAIAYAASKPLYGISTLDVLEYPCLEDGAIVCSLIDARNQRFFSKISLCKNTDDEKSVLLYESTQKPGLGYGFEYKNGYACFNLLEEGNYHIEEILDYLHIQFLRYSCIKSDCNIDVFPKKIIFSGEVKNILNNPSVDEMLSRLSVIKKDVHIEFADSVPVAKNLCAIALSRHITAAAVNESKKKKLMEKEESLIANNINSLREKDSGSMGAWEENHPGDVVSGDVASVDIASGDIALGNYFPANSFSGESFSENQFSGEPFPENHLSGDPFKVKANYISLSQAQRMKKQSGDITVEFAGPDDLDDIEYLENTAFSIPWSRTSLEIDMMHNPYSRYLKATTGNKKSTTGNEKSTTGNELIGYIGLAITFEQAQINNLAVHPAYRKQGVARSLLRRSFEVLKDEGCENVSLEVRENNIKAIKLYLSEGFRSSGVRKKYYADTGENAIIMLKTLLNL